MALNAKNRKVWDQIFKERERGDVKWKDFASLLYALGGTVKNRKGSGRIVRLRDEVAYFHEPHNGICGKVMVKRMQSFLEDSGVEP